MLLSPADASSPIEAAESSFHPMRQRRARHHSWANFPQRQSSFCSHACGRAITLLATRGSHRSDVDWTSYQYREHRSHHLEEVTLQVQGFPLEVLMVML